MISLEIYKVLHVVGALMVLASLGGAAAVAMSGEGKGHALRRTAVITHGLGLVILLVAGFGLLARLGITGFPWPIWVFIKLGVWLALGGMAAILTRRPNAGALLWWITLALGGLAVFSAIFKPFAG